MRLLRQDGRLGTLVWSVKNNQLMKAYVKPRPTGWLVREYRDMCSRRPSRVSRGETNNSEICSGSQGRDYPCFFKFSCARFQPFLGIPDRFPWKVKKEAGDTPSNTK